MDVRAKPEKREVVKPIAGGRELERRTMAEDQLTKARIRGGVVQWNYDRYLRVHKNAKYLHYFMQSISTSNQ